MIQFRPSSPNVVWRINSVGVFKLDSLIGKLIGHDIVEPKDIDITGFRQSPVGITEGYLKRNINLNICYSNVSKTEGMRIDLKNK